MPRNSIPAYSALRRAPEHVSVKFHPYVGCARYDSVPPLPGTIRRLCGCGVAIVCVPATSRLISSGGFEGLCPACTAQLEDGLDAVVEVVHPLAELEFEAIVGRRN